MIALGFLLGFALLISAATAFHEHKGNAMFVLFFQLSIPLPLVVW